MGIHHTKCFIEIPNSNKKWIFVHRCTSPSMYHNITKAPNSQAIISSDLNVIHHYDDVIMGTIASQITSLPSVYSTVYSGADQSKHQSSASLAFVWGIQRGPVNSPHKWPVTRKWFHFMTSSWLKKLIERNSAPIVGILIGWPRCRKLP